MATSAIRSESLLNKQPAAGSKAPINVGSMERTISTISGTLIALGGIARGRLPGLLLTAIGGGLIYRGVTGHCSCYQALGISTTHHNPRTSIPAKQGFKFEERVMVKRPAAELYKFWRQLENLPQVMPGLVSVEETGMNQSHWIAEGPLGNVEWDAEIITERENELIGWRSLEGSAVATSGSVHFREAPNNRGTEVEVVLKYNPIGGRVGAALAWLMGEAPEQDIREGLQSFKEKMEAGRTHDRGEYM